MPRSVYTTPLISPLLRVVAHLVLLSIGWRIETGPPDVSKAIVVGAPHTSNWDYVVFLCVMLILRMDVKVMVKDDVDRPPFRRLIRWAGVIPVNRRQSSTVVQQMVDEFNARDRLIVIITPEGTRKRVQQWKTGFYHIASGARIPVVLGYVDYARRRAGFGPVVWPSGKLEEDFADWQRFYHDKAGRHPELEMR